MDTLIANLIELQDFQTTVYQFNQFQPLKDRKQEKLIKKLLLTIKRKIKKNHAQKCERNYLHQKL